MTLCSSSASFDPVVVSHPTLFSRRAQTCTLDSTKTPSLKNIKKSAKQGIDTTRKVFKITKTVFDPFYKTLKFFCSGWFIKKLKRFEGILKTTKVFDIILVPFNLINLTNHISSITREDQIEKIDTTLNVARELGSLKDNVVTFHKGLESVGACFDTMSKISAALNVMSSIFSISSVLLNLRNISKMKRLQSRFSEIESLNPNKVEAALESYRAFLTLFNEEHIKDKSFLKRVFNYDEEKLIVTFIDIEKEVMAKIRSESFKDRLEGQQLLYKTIKGLKGRIQYNIHSSLIAASLSIATLFSATILLSYSILFGSVAASFLSLSRLSYQKLMEYKFSHELRLKRKWHEWIAC